MGKNVIHANEYRNRGRPATDIGIHIFTRNSVRRQNWWPFSSMIRSVINIILTYDREQKVVNYGTIDIFAEPVKKLAPSDSSSTRNRRCFVKSNEPNNGKYYPRGSFMSGH